MGFRFASADRKDTGKNPLPDLLDDKLIECNALMRGIINADAINTVSKTHVDEIQTPEYGEGLEEILKKNNHKLFGILNGLTGMSSIRPGIRKLKQITITANFSEGRKIN